MTRIIPLALAIICSPLATALAAPFFNLDFELATVHAAPNPHVPSDALNAISAASALPGWTAMEDSTVVNALWSGDQVLDETSIYLVNSASSLYAPIDGKDSVELYGVALFANPFFKTASISQTGDIPADARSIQLLVNPLFGSVLSTPVVTIGGTTIPLTAIASSGGITTLAGDITSLAGTTAPLTITAAGTSTNDVQTGEDLFVVDDISFSTDVVPEPSALLLAGLAVVALGLTYFHRGGAVGFAGA